MPHHPSHSRTNLPSPAAGGGGAEHSEAEGVQNNPRQRSSLPLHRSVQATQIATERARTFRNSATPPERRPWNALRNRQLAGLRFRRQHPLGPYIADFYCHQASLVVEIDGSTHQGLRILHDRERDRWMTERRLRVLRFPATLIRDDLETVLRTIEHAATKTDSLPPPSSLRDATSPAGGGGGEV